MCLDSFHICVCVCVSTCFSWPCLLFFNMLLCSLFQPFLKLALKPKYGQHVGWLGFWRARTDPVILEMILVDSSDPRVCTTSVMLQKCQSRPGTEGKCKSDPKAAAHTFSNPARNQCAPRRHRSQPDNMWARCKSGTFFWTWIAVILERRGVLLLDLCNHRTPACHRDATLCLSFFLFLAFAFATCRGQDSLSIHFFHVPQVRKSDPKCFASRTMKQVAFTSATPEYQLLNNISLASKLPEKDVLPFFTFQPALLCQSSHQLLQKLLKQLCKPPQVSHLHPKPFS